nr:hypothetical protein [Tanacetum cinerariifolium]
MGCVIQFIIGRMFGKTDRGVNGEFFEYGNETKKGNDKWGGDQGCNHGGMMQERDSECQQSMAEGRFEHQEGWDGVGAAKNDSHMVKLLVELGADP